MTSRPLQKCRQHHPTQCTHPLYMRIWKRRQSCFVGRGLLMQRDQDKLSLFYFGTLCAECIKQKGTTGNNQERSDTFLMISNCKLRPALPHLSVVAGPKLHAGTVQSNCSKSLIHCYVCQLQLKFETSTFAMCRFLIDLILGIVKNGFYIS